MIFFARPTWILLILCLALYADATHGQSLSIVIKGDKELFVEADVPAQTRYILQESGNCRIWADLDDDVQGHLSFRLDAAGVTKRFLRLIPWTPPGPPIRVVLLGDSTVAGQEDWGSGWGKAIHGYFKSTVQVVNLAWPNMSTSVFLASEQKPKMLAIKPDFVLLQFGWIDWGGCNGDPRCTTTLPEFADNLRTIVREIRGFNGTPILITQPDPRVFDEHGKVNPTLQDRAAVMKEVAAELHTHLIDLNQMSRDTANALGKNGCAFIGLTPNDWIHYSLEGAQLISGLVVNALPNKFEPYLVGILNPLLNP